MRYPYTWLLSNLAWADAEEWASAFEDATGLNLEACMVKKGW